LPWRSPTDACGPLELVARFQTSGRLQIALAPEVDPVAPPGVRALARALSRLTPEAQLAVARTACGKPTGTVDEASSVLASAGVVPVPVLDGSPATAPLPPPSGPLLDGAPTTFLDALSLGKPPSLRRRLGASGQLGGQLGR